MRNFGLIVILLMASLNISARVVAESGFGHVQMIELFSSESCSSCPPADVWIAKFETHPELFKKFVPVVFHVDYWNYLNWKDELSSDRMTRRQQNLAQSWPRPSVYTPAVVVDGKELKNWSSSSLLFQTKAKSFVNLIVNEEKAQTYKVKVVFEKNFLITKNYTLRIAELGMGFQSNVTSGENKGRRLMHNFVVLDWQNKEISQNSVSQFEFKPSSLKTKKRAVVAWIEEADLPAPIQATGGFL